MKDSITDSIRRHGFKRLLIAVSGGLDSICLAHYFICNKEALGIEWLGIAHVHHGLREGTADRDAAFVEAFARKYNVPFFLKRLDGEVLKAAEGSLEENARDARYKALVEVFNETEDPRLRGDDNKDVIVTAHHAGDQAETMYMRLKRGTTLAGLRGIQSLRALDSIGHTCASRCGVTQQASLLIIHHPSSIIHHQSKFIYRPFLNVTRKELLAYARENNLTWCEDESNTDVKFARNKVRHELLPQLERECPGAAEQLCRIAEIADRAYAKVIAKGEAVFDSVLVKQDPSTPLRFAQDDTPALTLDKKKLNKILREHANADLSEMFRLWLAEQGFRFPIGFFYGPKEPAHVKIPHRAAYRKRSIAKIGHTIKICEFCTPEEAQKFVSCE
ncbi:tRNA(Ile)-lysidine synthase [Fibrobacter sp. UWCM]|uniref:tRNA lysidine(34) synthetase TilS n=1 Tax=Fibrobacter sp. UWCM TaxID=1896208 RepID=UPI0009146380|nr:tRNA lysidine(34) synthetase TilS [Fibrobacter sp. UWCM]SHG91172.1 tRNA(Ile)-lysidine synthase [Fibrobacter sp. UWCM]